MVWEVGFDRNLEFVPRNAAARWSNGPFGRFVSRPSLGSDLGFDVGERGRYVVGGSIDTRYLAKGPGRF